MKKLLFILLLVVPLSTYSQVKRDSVLVTTEIFQVMYSEVLEQPLWLTYVVRDIEKVADRKGMDFWEPEDVYTSDDEDYYKNVWDKGHLAPAAHFTDSYEYLYGTFNYVNSALQHQRLNRGAWRFLEAKEREWAGYYGNINVKVLVLFSEESEVLTTGATVPDAFRKNLHVLSTGEKICFYFPNEAPDKVWEEYEVSCE